MWSQKTKMMLLILLSLAGCRAARQRQESARLLELDRQEWSKRRTTPPVLPRPY